MNNLLTKHIIDLTDNSTTALALSKFEELVESNGFSNSSLGVVLGKLVLTHGHMARLNSLAEKHSIKIEVIYTNAVQTQLAALNVGLLVAEKAPGEMLLEEFKKSLTVPEGESECTSQCTMQQENNDVVADNTEVFNNAADFENENPEPPKMVDEKPVENVDPSSLPPSEEDYKLIDDVVEVFDSEDQMVQQKMNLDLPFEKKVSVVEPAATTAPESKESVEMTTLYIHQTLRSGQVVAHNGHVVIAGDTHPGSEVVAGGDIIVWGTLGGVAHAGAGNNYKASIRALKMNPIQIRIADYIARRPDRKNFLSNELPVKPEVARISNGEIRIFSLK